MYGCASLSLVLLLCELLRMASLSVHVYHDALNVDANGRNDTAVQIKSSLAHAYMLVHVRMMLSSCCYPQHVHDT